ncbi:MAG: rRNA-processing protein and EBNA1-binding protein ebp2 [Claussenomyces sp. TS43310]|nr:MAG: rRNA-processing protein and EBNA1-binding protein ebp2 [Claussenomyces sp. TS43310]
MVNKSKLKMALLNEKPVDFKKQHQKKMTKVARKHKATKDAKKGAVAGAWEDLAEGEDDEGELDGADNGGATLDEAGSENDDPAPQIDLAGIDDSDSGSSSGVEDNNGIENSSGDEEEEDDEDIPMSELEDLPDEEKEDVIPHQRLTINNTSALTTALKRIALPLSSMTFSEHQSLTTAEPVSIPDVSDDLTRELAFYSQCLSAVKDARGLLKEEKAPFSRPNDYFAEMVKADEHMAKIKAKLIDAAASKKAAADARKQRDLKKFGKQVQVAKLQERDKERKTTLEKIKTLKRRRQDTDGPTETEESALFDVALDDAAEDGSRDRNRESRGKSGDNKRAKKDSKYGHGGKKRFAKSGDAMSSGDLSGFSVKAMKGRAGGGSAKKQRPGKARRASGKR